VDNNMQNTTKILLLRLKIPIIFGFLFLFAPFAEASNHTFTCSDLTMNSSATCTSGGTINFFVGGLNQYAYNSGAAFTYTGGSTLYVVADTTGTNGAWDLEVQQGSGSHTLTNFSNGQVGFAVSVGSGGDPTGMVIKPDIAGGVSASAGTISNLCFSNVSLADCGYSGGGGGGGGATTTENQATSTPDQVQENLFNGFVIFFTSMIFVVWFFRSKRA